jgi:hypothetical protein
LDDANINSLPESSGAVPCPSGYAGSAPNFGAFDGDRKTDHQHLRDAIFVRHITAEAPAFKEIRGPSYGFAWARIRSCFEVFSVADGCGAAFGSLRWRPALIAPPVSGHRHPTGRKREMATPRGTRRSLSRTAPPLDQRIGRLDWSQIAAELDEHGCATAGPFLTESECAALVATYDEPAFRSHIVMARHGFGRGEYKYFAYPLPAIVASLRSLLYPRLADVANRWQRALEHRTSYPRDHERYLARCHTAGQRRPTPLMLKYGPGDFNCLHQDLYGEHVFPLQATFLLSVPGKDFTGGEFVMTEQRPRMQSRAQVVSLARGEAVIFAVNRRPVRGARGTYSVTMRHGVSRLISGSRFTLGIIFHDAM